MVEESEADPGYTGQLPGRQSGAMVLSCKAGMVPSSHPRMEGLWQDELCHPRCGIGQGTRLFPYSYPEPTTSLDA